MGYYDGSCLHIITVILFDLGVDYAFGDRYSQRLLAYQILMPGVVIACLGCHKVCCFQFSIGSTVVCSS